MNILKTMLGIGEERIEERADNYTQAVAQITEKNANAPSKPDIEATSVVEMCAGIWSRAFMIADVMPITKKTRPITHKLMGIIGRELFMEGDIVIDIDVDKNRVVLTPALTADITGNYKNWMYRLELPGPTVNSKVNRSADSVIHLTYGSRARNPWQGTGPVQAAEATGSLAANLEQRLAQEAGGPVGNLIPTPDGAGTNAGLQSDIKNLDGRTVLVPSTRGGWDAGEGAYQRDDWQPRRLGLNVPMPTVQLRSEVVSIIVASTGIPAQLVDPSSESSAIREGWRTLLHGTISPIATMVAEELAYKLDTPDLTITFDKLFASDVQGRARAFQSLRAAEMEVAKAERLSGLGE